MNSNVHRGLCSVLGLLLVATAPGCGTSLDRLADALRARIAESGADAVGVYFRDLETGDSLVIDGDTRMHAASMMKVPVMIQLFRDAEAGRLALDDSLILTASFRSIVDGSAYELSVGDDSDTLFYRRLGERESLRRLMERMITVSSNLAANMLIELVDARRVTATVRALGADSIEVLRGVEDIKAYEAGLSNTTTARDLGVIFAAIAQGRAAAPASCDSMIAVLGRQELNEKIPAGLPSGVRVAHKTGDITGIHHDGGVVTLADGRRYVLVVLTRGVDEAAKADSMIADVSRLVYQYVAR